MQQILTDASQSSASTLKRHILSLRKLTLQNYQQQTLHEFATEVMQGFFHILPVKKGVPAAEKVTRLLSGFLGYIQGMFKRLNRKSDLVLG
jgi:hypothetical protein